MIDLPYAEFIQQQQDMVRWAQRDYERELAAARKEREAKIAFAKARDLDDRMIEMMIGGAV